VELTFKVRYESERNVKNSTESVQNWLGTQLNKFSGPVVNQNKQNLVGNRG